MANVERPLDMLNDCRGKFVEIEVSNSKEAVEGRLLAFDIHINLVIEQSDKRLRFIRGECVETIAERKGK